MRRSVSSLTLIVVALLLVIGLLGCNEKPSERMVVLNGSAVYLKIEGRGKPTVVVENALGGTAGFWDSIQTVLSERTSIVTYDRPGNGRSDASASPRTNSQMARELHLLLHEENIEPPYLLVGASYGAFIVRAFTNLYPSEVAGMVLVEPVHEDLLPEMRKTRTEAQWNQYIDVMNQMAANAPEGPRQEWEYYFHNSDSIRQVRFPSNIPVTILTSTRYSDREMQMMYLEADIRKKVELHEAWVRDRSNVSHIKTDISGHDIAGREPQLVVDAVLSTLDRVRMD